MSKKQEFLRGEQSRDKHPDRLMRGSAAELSLRGLASKGTRQPRAGKVENDHNKHGQAQPTQLHESLRTPRSRNDREARLGSSNQSQLRRGGPGRGQR